MFKVNNIVNFEHVIASWVQLLIKKIEYHIFDTQCLVGLNKDEEALRYIKEASMLDPKNKVSK